jgi:hypothetical protein
MGGGMLRYPVKLVLICAGLCGIVLGAHGLYVHFSPSEIVERAFAGTLDPTRLFLGLDVPSWFKGTVQWASEKGADSWVIPAGLIIGGILIIGTGLGINTRSQLLSRIWNKIW